MPHRLPEDIGSSIAHFTSSKDLSSEDRFKWASARNFVYFASIYASQIFNNDLFSKIAWIGNILDYLIAVLFVGIPYMCADVFIKQYTRRIDFNDALCPLLKGIIITSLLQSMFINVWETADAGDATRYLLSSLYGSTAWSGCHHSYNASLCITPVEAMRRCSKDQLIFFNYTSAHLTYMSHFSQYDRAIITTRLFVNAVLWILNFFISTVSDTAILKFYKIVFWFDNLFTVFVLCILMFFTDHTNEALSTVMDKHNAFTYMNTMMNEVVLIYGIGAVGVYDLGILSAFTMVDNAVLLFSGIYLFFALMRSMIVTILYLQLEHCIEFDYNMMTPHYLNFAVLPLSTEFLYGQKLYTTYLYLRIIITIIAYLSLFTLTVTKILHDHFHSVKSVYIVGILCFIGFLSSVPMVLVQIQSTVMHAFFGGVFSSLYYMGGIRMAIIMWVYGVEKFSTDIHFWLGFKPTKYWTLTWRFLPVLLLVGQLRNSPAIERGFSTSLAWAVKKQLQISVAISLASALCIPSWKVTHLTWCFEWKTTMRLIHLYMKRIQFGMSLYELGVYEDTLFQTLAIGWVALMVFIVAVHQINTIVYYVLNNKLIGAFKCSKKYGSPDLKDRILRWNYNSTIYHRRCFHNCMILDEGIDCNHLPLMNKGQKSSLDDSEDASLMHLFEAGPSRVPSSLLNWDDYLNVD